jgi:hypothetical protein
MCIRAWLAAAPTRATRAGEALSRYRDNDQIARVIGPDGYLHGLDLRQRRLSQANLDVAELRARYRTHDLPPSDQIRRALPEMAIAEQHALLAQIIDTVFVAPGPGGAAQRVTVCQAGSAPRGLSRQGYEGAPHHPIGTQRNWINPTPPTASPPPVTYRWPDPRARPTTRPTRPARRTPRA